MKLVKKAGFLAFDLKLDSAIAIYRQLKQLNPDDPKAAWRIEAFSRNETLPILQGQKLVTVKGGPFMMGGEGGDEIPIHNVVPTGYKIGTCEVTNGQFAAFLNQYGSTTLKEGEYKGQVMIEEHRWGVQRINNKWQAAKDKEKHPVVMVSWYGAYKFCRFFGLSLPTEAQWEYAARGRAKTEEVIYSGSNDLGKVAVFNTDSTERIGSKNPNELDLYDMSGNVWEWCNDWYSAGYYSERIENDPQGCIKVLN